MHKFFMLMTTINNKMQEPKTYNKTINNPIHKNRWQKAIDKEL